MGYKQSYELFYEFLLYSFFLNGVSTVTYFLHIGQIFCFASQSLMHQQWCTWLHLSIVTYSPLLMSSQQIQQLYYLIFVHLFLYLYISFHGLGIEFLLVDFFWEQGKLNLCKTFWNVSYLLFQLQKFLICSLKLINYYLAFEQRKTVGICVIGASPMIYLPAIIIVSVPALSQVLS